jgi:hypothetical protein
VENYLIRKLTLCEQKPFFDGFLELGMRKVRIALAEGLCGYGGIILADIFHLGKAYRASFELYPGIAHKTENLSQFCRVVTLLVAPTWLTFERKPPISCSVLIYHVQP